MNWQCVRPRIKQKGQRKSFQIGSRAGHDIKQRENTRRITWLGAGANTEAVDGKTIEHILQIDPRNDWCDFQGTMTTLA